MPDPFDGALERVAERVYAALWLDGAAAGWAVLALVAVFSLARGFSSVASKDVLGKTVPKTRRGRVNGFASSAAGIGTLGIGVFAADAWAPTFVATAWFLPGCFLLLSLLHDGVRLGRKTDVVDLGEGNKRTDYVAVGNSLMVGFLLLAGGISAAVQALSTGAAILLLSLAAVLTAWLARRLPEVQKD